MSRFIDLTGQKFGRLTVIGRAENDKSGKAMWYCVCDCGNNRVIVGGNLKSKLSKSCGCLNIEKLKSREIDLTGMRFGRLSVISNAGSHKTRKGSIWNCVCDCGNASIVSGSELRIGHTKSCGCLVKEVSIINGSLCIDIHKRLDKYIDKSSGRWIWTFNKDKDGYGRIFYNGKTQRAHRVIYELFVGEIPEGLCVCHKNDIPLDVTPDNLFLGTTQENSQDKVDKDRQAKGETSGNSKLKERDVLEIRKSNSTIEELSEMYNVHKTTIYNIVKNKTWKHI